MTFSCTLLAQELAAAAAAAFGVQMSKSWPWANPYGKASIWQTEAEPFEWCDWKCYFPPTSWTLPGCNVQKAVTKMPLLPVSNGGPLTSPPPGCTLLCGGCCTPDAPVVRAGLVKGGLSSSLGENCQAGVTLWGNRGTRQQHQRRSQGQSWAVCLESGWKRG